VEMRFLAHVGAWMYRHVSAALTDAALFSGAPGPVLATWSTRSETRRLHQPNFLFFLFSLVKDMERLGNLSLTLAV